MTIEEAIFYSKEKTSMINSRTLVSYVTGYKINEISNHFKEEVTKEQIDKLNKCLEELLNNKPLQYITNSVNFCGLDLYVDENVLIPRFETEELVQNTVEFLKEFNNPKILDLCCGSGAIGLALKDRINNSNVTMSDISNKALAVAKRNKEKLNLDVTIIESDLFNNINDKFDCIVSNPPYIRDDEEIDNLVKENEPSLALYGGELGLDYYERILRDIKNYLNNKFLIAFEIGKDQKDLIINIINKYLKDIEIVTLKDLSNNDRMIFIKSINV